MPDLPGLAQGARAIAMLLLASLTAAASSAAPVNKSANRGLSPATDRAARPAQAIAGLVGTVSAGYRGHGSVPLPDAGVYAYQVTDLTIHKAQTDLGGGFSFAALPAGVYKLIVHKTGFLPAVVLVTRTTASAFQELQFELFPDTSKLRLDENDTASDFWQIRKRIPADVLREIRIAHAAPMRDQEMPRLLTPNTGTFVANMHALSGSGDFARTPNANVIGGHVSISGQVGDLDVDLVGNFRTLKTQHADTVGRAQSMAFNLHHESSGDFKVSTRTGSLQDGINPIDLERYGVGWEGSVGAGRTAISANYTSETNYYRDARADLFAVPDSSRTFDIEGTYNQRISRRTNVETGVRYRERGPLSLSQQRATAVAPSRPITERVDLFGLGALDVKRSLSLQYGLFTTLWEGAVAFTPHAGIVLNLPNQWTAEGSVRQRLHENADDWTADFLPAHHRQQFECTAAEEGCYRLKLTRELGDGDAVEFGALYRHFADTIRLYFSDDLFNELDSVFLVDGDRLPEVHFAVSHRLTPQIMTRFASNIARGGGGAVGTELENEVSYMVTSFEGQFEATETGVVLSFHSVEQHLKNRDGIAAQDPIAKDRVQLQITQGLSRLMGFSQNLNLILDMQVSRGEEQRLAQANDELSRRILGGIALRF